MFGVSDLGFMGLGFRIQDLRARVWAVGSRISLTAQLFPEHPHLNPKL